MQIHELSDLIYERKRSNELYLEFLRSEKLSAGLYELKAGSIDSQQPHTEDEVYYVIKGRGSIQIGEERRKVKSGTIVFVNAKVDHRFLEIAEDLSILVIFAPPEATVK